jgi:uncharacterized protein YbjT (DUF2867 family)
MIVITGATGALNGATVDHLLSKVPASEIAVAVRDAAKARRFAERGVEVRYGDYADPASLPAAFAGADAVSLHRTAIEAAVAADVGRILYTSHQGAALDSPFRPARHHAATEQLLAASGVAWTSLRNGFYAHSLTWLMGPWRQTGVVAVPADGPVSWTARADAAEAAAAVLASNGAFDGPTTITAGTSPTFEEIAGIAVEVTGRHITVEILDQDLWLAQQIAAGQPEVMARFTLGMYQAAHEGYFAGTDPLLEKLLGRAPQTVRDLLHTSV